MLLSAEDTHRWTVLLPPSTINACVAEELGPAEVTSVLSSFYNKTSLSCAPSPCQEGELPWPGKPGQCFRIKVKQLKVSFLVGKTIFPQESAKGRSDTPIHSNFLNFRPGK